MSSATVVRAWRKHGKLKKLFITPSAYCWISTPSFCSFDSTSNRFVLLIHSLMSLTSRLPNCSLTLTISSQLSLIFVQSRPQPFSAKFATSFAIIRLINWLLSMVLISAKQSRNTSSYVQARGVLSALGHWLFAIFTLSMTTPFPLNTNTNTPRISLTLSI